MQWTDQERKFHYEREGNLIRTTCLRCKRVTEGWPLVRPDVCSPKGWVQCIRNP